MMTWWIRSTTMPDHLLDVNVLVAHAILEHTHHEIVAEALRRALENGTGLFVCPIVELGLIRNAMRIGSISVQEARQLLENEYKNLRLRFIPDSLSASHLPNAVHGYRQTTDAYLSELALEHGLTLLTIDKGIPGAVQIRA